MFVSHRWTIRTEGPAYDAASIRGSRGAARELRRTGWTRTHRDPERVGTRLCCGLGRGPRLQAGQAPTECADRRRRCRTGGSAHGDARLHAWRACNARMFPAACVDPSCRGHRHPPSTWRIQLRQRKRRRNSGRKTTRAGPHCATPARRSPSQPPCSVAPSVEIGLRWN